jgi:thiamine biosynthesis protein ThiS
VTDPGRTLEGAAFLSVRITVNGQPMDVADGLSVEALLRQLEVKREFTPKSAYDATMLSAGDRVEIVRPMGGGR